MKKEENREELTDESLAEGVKVADEYDIKTERRIRRRKRMAGEIAEDVEFSLTQEIAAILRMIIDRLKEEIRSRSTRLCDFQDRFGQLLNMDYLFSSSLNLVQLKQYCRNFSKFYIDDVDADSLYKDILDCRMLLMNTTETGIAKPSNAYELLQIIIKYGNDFLCDLRIALVLPLL